MPPESDPLNDPEVASCPVAPDARYTPDMVSDVGAAPVDRGFARGAIAGEPEFDGARVELHGERAVEAARPGGVGIADAEPAGERSGVRRVSNVSVTDPLRSSRARPV